MQTVATHMYTQAHTHTQMHTPTQMHAHTSMHTHTHPHQCAYHACVSQFYKVKTSCEAIFFLEAIHMFSVHQ